MDEMIPFLRAIAENPDDDVPRLAFSDWLEEHGDHARAEFIRLQIELARMDPGDDRYPEKTARMRRCGVFTRKGKLPFFDHLPTRKCRIAFRRGLIESIHTVDAEKIDSSGFDLIPLQALRTRGKLIGKFKAFTKLKWLEYDGRDATPAQLLEVLGPDGWFKRLEELSLPDLNRACLEGGVIPQFDLPRLRNFYLSTDPFFQLGAPTPSDGGQDDDYYSGRRPWAGLPEYLPRNALPSPKTPLERFVWHSDDDCDFFNNEDWYWRGPTMESLLAHLKTHDLKQFEVATDYNDHEGGTEGVITAPYRRSPLELAPTLERVTLDPNDLRLLEGSTRKLKELRVYGSGFHDFLFTLLSQPVCSELESLHVEARCDDSTAEPEACPRINLPKLKSLRLSWLLERFSNCDFPNLTALRGVPEFKAVLGRKWPKLQYLDLNLLHVDRAALSTFAQSDCCPNLTTLFIDGYSDSTKEYLSFLANCPHMPYLSLVRFDSYPKDLAYIIDGGKPVPVRGDVMPEGQTPTTPYRLTSAF